MLSLCFMIVLIHFFTIISNRLLSGILLWRGKDIRLKSEVKTIQRRKNFDKCDEIEVMDGVSDDYSEGN